MKNINRAKRIKNQKAINMILSLSIIMIAFGSLQIIRNVELTLLDVLAKISIAVVISLVVYVVVSIVNYYVLENK